MRFLLALLLAGCPGGGGDPVTPGSGSAPVVTAPPVDAWEPSQEERLAAIQKAMNELDEAAQGCWAAAAVERFDIEGEIAATIDISPAGAQVVIARDSTRSKLLAECLVQLLAKYPWAPPLHGQAIQLPFKFRAPAAGQNVIDRRLVPWRAQDKIGLAVLLDSLNSGNDDVSVVELALQAGGSTGQRIAERAELWFFLGDARVNGKAIEAGDMLYVAANAGREITATADMHAVIAFVPGGREGAARAGALPTREGKGTTAITPLLAASAKAFCLGGGVPPCPRGQVTIFAEPATTKAHTIAASMIEIPAGGAVPEHVHAAETEVLYVLAGAGTMTVAGVALPVNATSVVQIPANTKHAFTATEAVRALQIYTPAGPEQRFKK